jgi:hypothetical protein
MFGAASGMLFGVSDISLKAMSGLAGAHGVLGIVSPWLLVALLASVVAFFSSAKSLQDGDPIPVIAVTSTAATVSGILGGIVVFGDPFPAHVFGIVVQCLAFLLVVFAAWVIPAPARASRRGTPAIA